MSKIHSDAFTHLTHAWSDTAVREEELYQKAHRSADRLIDFLTASPTAWQAVDKARLLLDEAGFSHVTPSTIGDIKPGSCGYFIQNGSSIIAYSIGSDPLQGGFRIFGAHSDSPALKIKPNAISKSEEVWRLNTEVYGGPLLSTWFDRPLSLAGRVVLKGSSPLKVELRLIDFKRPILILPNIAIHMNRNANDGVKIERQKVLLPFLCCAGEEADEQLLEHLIAEELGCDITEILDFELLTYEVNPPSYCGLNDCFISSGRLDNLAMTQCGLQALIETKGRGTGINILLVTDNEEVGSMTKQGADSLFVRDMLESILIALGADRQSFLGFFERSFMISADLAHAAHPNYGEMADPNHRPRVNGGPVIKIAASQSYASDACSIAVFRQLAEAAGSPYQLFVNRSDLRGGSTIGPISSSLLPMSTVDIGNPIWGMHSCRETGGLLDGYYLEEICKVFYKL